ncbi:hypothetical protein TBR22_A20810 [Luteitalea sp. TBR-22]|uniref:PEGA domain-containing protein n=1 Tax=Luteitalea sp. TBR-22 TaxID=2802971 RepID=UPI001AF50902|nr:PEGA domain-containing protein [Luteitalea sp. TBR-22]BCS32857.1 hypothetical protein TBR22_A20810 [Luteitalea sp. TBR-22]
MVTEPERPAGAPSGGPTPEEISARLEALLKRTHALRAERAASPTGPPLSVTWPPPDRELDHYDVVDVHNDEGQGAQGASVAAPASATPAAPAQSFSRPDWSELRLRTSPVEVPERSPWIGVVAALLAVLALAEAGYIWYLHSAQPVVTEGHLRVDGPDGAEVRIDGQPVGRAPVEQDLAPGVYQVEVQDGGSAVRAERVAISRGRTVVLLPLTSPASAAQAGPQGQATAADGTLASPAPGSVAAAGGADAVSETTGAVAIESTPPGLPVTMGGRPRGVTPITLGQIKPGRHDVLVGGSARQVDVRAGQVTTLRVSR